MQPRPTRASADDDAHASALVCGILHALVAKLNLSLCDVDEAVAQLGDAFENMTRGAKDLPEHDEEAGGRERQAMHALQFHDRLDQRLQHVSRALLQIAAHLESGLLVSRDWTALARELSEACPIESDKKLFDALLDQASKTTISDHNEPTPRRAGEVELF